MNLSALIADRAAAAPDAPAIRDPYAGDTDWATLDDRVARVAGALRARGLAPGDRVALIAPNGRRFFETFFGIARAGLTAVPLNYRLHPEELVFLLSDSGAGLLLLHEMFGDALGDRRPPAETVTFAEGGGDAWDAEVASARPADTAPAGPDDTVGIFYTGGTTGRPKGVELSHGNLRANGEHIAPRFGYRADDVYLHAAPMFHLADLGALMGQLIAGGAHAFLPTFSPGGFARTVKETGATVGTLAPTMINMILNDPAVDPADLSSLRLVLYGGGPIGEAVLARALDRLACDWLQGYGQTEATHTVCFLGPKEHREMASAPHRLRSCGRPIEGVQVQIGDDVGRALPVGEVGEVQVKGPIVMRRYWNRPEETARAFADGWLRTGDLGRQDADGYVYLVDRAKDMIVTGAENVYSAEVENALASCPGILEAAVIGVPDERWGERVHAIVVSAAGGALDLAAIQSHCRNHLAGYKVPRSADFVDDLPKTATGKIAKSVLRAPYWAGQGRSIG